MAIETTRINHVGLVVRDEAKASEFYVDVLGLRRHARVESWLVVGGGQTLHLIEIPEAAVDSSLYHEVQHVALEVTSRREAAKLLLAAGLAPFQMDFNGTEQQISSPESSLDFGIGTVFVRDPDGNLVELIEIGQGVFKE